MARTDQPHKLTFDSFVAKCTDFSNPLNEKHAGLDYSRPETRAAWNGSKSKIPIWCETHQEFFVQMAANHMSLGQGCPKCGKDVYKAKRQKSDPIADFRKVHGDTYDYSQMVYTNVQNKITIICREHGPFEQKPNSHLQGQGCPQCWENRRKAFGKARNESYRAAYAERAARVHNGAYSILRLPMEAHDTVMLNCPKHGDFEQKAFSHLDGHGCPTCGGNVSNAQKQITTLIESFGVEVERENRTVLGDRLHIDIWVPAQKIGIEYHGSYWHTQARVGNKHREKWERAEKAGIRLIQVFDFEWLGNPLAVEARLRSLFGLSEPVAARKCELREVSRSEAAAFFREVHTQGPGSNPEVAYGLFYEGALAACMSFGKNRFKGEGWELLRYASKARVQGGFSRLFKAFTSEHNPEIITSYCDLRWGDGNVYRTAGFDLDGVTNPDYWYTFKDKRIFRYAARNRPKGQTEKEWAEEHGYEKVLGVGHQRWVWRAQPASQALNPVI